MTTLARTPRVRFRPAFLAAVVLCAGLAVGCKSKGSGGGLFSSGGGDSDNSDPLLGGRRIPPQDLPIPGRGNAYGAGNKKDPLLDPGTAVPTSDAEKTERAGKPKKNNDAARRTEPGVPFRPGASSTPAALAALPTDDSDLSIGERKPAVVPASGVPASIPGSRLGYDQVLNELKRYGATWDVTTGKNGEAVFRCDVPLPGGTSGQVRHYEGSGATRLEAALQVFEQVRDDIRGR